MKKFLFLIVSCLFVVFALSGCGDKVEGDTLEQTRLIAKENATFNGKQYRGQDPRLSDYQLIPNGDSSIQPNCPMGDGWATIELVNANNTGSVKLKCSTNSRATGCLLASEFAKKSEYQDGSCNSKMPYPIKKIAE